jgi:hypothetical protein
MLNLNASSYIKLDGCSHRQCSIKFLQYISTTRGFLNKPASFDLKINF